MTEGEKAIKIKFSLSLPQSFFCEKRQLLPSCGIPILFMRLGAPHKIDRCANRCSLYPPQAAVAYVARQMEPVLDNRKGCPYGCANILISYQPKIVINQRQSNGGSKPPPYHVVVCTVSFATAFGCLSLTMQLLLFRKNHARLACSVVNALTTAHCRYQLLRFADRDALWSPANS